MYFSSWEVNPPNPTGYAPQMSVACMNDPGPIDDPSGAIDPATGQIQKITDPAYNPAYSNFCYETPFMPGFTAYMDTPVTPVQAFADGRGQGVAENRHDMRVPGMVQQVGQRMQGGRRLQTPTAVSTIAIPDQLVNSVDVQGRPLNRTL